MPLIPPPTKPSQTNRPSEIEGERPVQFLPVTLGDRVVSTAMWGLGFSWLIPVTTGLKILQQFAGPETLEPLTRLLCRGQVVMTGSKWKAVVDPAVDAQQPYLFAINHINHFDFASMYNATPHFKQGLELESHFKYPFYGQFAKKRGTIPVPVDRARRSEAIHAGIRQEVERGHSILCFPEGTRTTSGRVGSFRTGVFRIARDLGLPIAPTAVTGMFDVMRKGSLVIRPGKNVTVFVDKPVETKGVPDSELEDLVRHVQGVVAKRVDDYFESEGRG